MRNSGAKAAYHGLPSHLFAQLVLGNAVLFHEQAQHFARFGVRHRMSARRVGRYQFAHQVQKARKRMMLIIPDLVEETVRNRPLVLLLRPYGGTPLGGMCFLTGGFS